MRSAGADRGRWLWPALPVTVLFAAHVLRGANTTVAALILALAEALVLAAFLSSPRLRSGLRRTRGLGAIGLCFGLVLAAAAWSTAPWLADLPSAGWRRSLGLPSAGALDISATVIELIKLCGMACLFLVGAMLGGRAELQRPLRRLILGAGLGFAIIALVLFGTGQQALGGHRLAGNFMSPNTAGTVFGILTLLSLAEIRWPHRPRVRVPTVRAHGGQILASAPTAALVAAFLVCLLLTGSRGAWIATLCGLMAFVALRTAAGRLSRTAALCLVLGAAAAFLALIESGGQSTLRRLQGFNGEARERTEILRTHWAFFLKSPWRGWGLGSFSSLNDRALTERNFGLLWDLRAAHNVLVQWLEEAGILGAALAFAAVGLSVWGALERALSTGRWVHVLLAVDVLVFVHSLDDFALQVPSVAGLWALLLGVQLSAAQSGKRSDIRHPISSLKLPPAPALIAGGRVGFGGM
jgi:O-antigen ligase